MPRLFPASTAHFQSESRVVPERRTPIWHLVDAAPAAGQSEGDGANCLFPSMPAAGESGSADPGFYACITCPPSMFSVCPVMLAACADARKTAIAANSAGVCHRPSGAILRIFSSAQVA